MNFEFDEYSKMGCDIVNIKAIKEYTKDKDKNSFYIYYRVDIHFNYKTSKITKISIYQGFDKNSDDLNINLELFVKEHINYFREAQLEELFKTDLR